MIERNGWIFPDLDTHFIASVGEYPNTLYQQQAIDFAYQFVKNFDTAIDVGANVGLHSVRFAQKFKNVFSFEPVSVNYECLEKNIKMFPNVTHYKLGLGETEKKEIISLPKDSNNCGAYSIVDFSNIDKKDLLNEEIEIKKLDSFNLSCDLLKIDAQSFEVPILKGSSNLLIRCKPVIILELEFKKNMIAMNALLNPYGYQLAQTFQKDKVWVHKDRL